MTDLNPQQNPSDSYTGMGGGKILPFPQVPVSVILYWVFCGRALETGELLGQPL